MSMTANKEAPQTKENNANAVLDRAADHGNHL
jgi:hypothetical protein